jgi:hypothetical protein
MRAPALELVQMLLRYMDSEKLELAVAAQLTS